MNTILLEPTDILFFRDGRPMGGSSAGHGAAWPLPSVLSHALHAALHRAGFQGVHAHRRGRSGSYSEERDRKFGSLKSVGPFPVCTNGDACTWFFPRPADAGEGGVLAYAPVGKGDGTSSLRAPCTSPVASLSAPSKDVPSPWWSEGAWVAYLGSEPRNYLAARQFYKADGDFADFEHAYGIGIDADTGSVKDGAFYSAHYLRLQPGWNLGALAEARDKDYRHETHGDDLVRALLDGHGRSIVVGGQQRVCSAQLDAGADRLPLPMGLKEGFAETNGACRVKWILLTPAIFPAIGNHDGGWLPSWVNQETGRVELLDGPGKNAASRKHVPQGQPIPAKLVAAIVPKALPVTGYALPQSADPDRAKGGAKSLHLAVPAGAVYYFETESAAAASKLAVALNCHGPGPGDAIVNRRSTLLGEQGFGLGVCGTWDYFNESSSGTSPDVTPTDTPTA